MFEGSLISVKAPGGRFLFDREDTTPLLLIAEGIGITPLLAILESAAASGRRAMLVFASTLEELRPFRVAIESLCRSHPNVTARFLVSRSSPVGRQKEALLARIDEGILSDTDAAAHVYICGPTGFIAAAHKALRDGAGVDRTVFTETFGDSRDSTISNAGGSSLAGTHIVRFLKSNFEATWDASAGTLLDLAEAHGLRPPFGCRAGTCGECATIIEPGALRYLNLVDSPPIDEALICTCIPTQTVELDL